MTLQAASAYKKTTKKKDHLAPEIRAKMPLPVRKKPLSYAQDGAKYYQPIPLTIIRYTGETQYHLKDIRRIFQNIEPTLHNFDTSYMNKSAQQRLTLDDIKKISRNLSPNLRLHSQIALEWIKLQESNIRQEICSEFDIQNPKDLLSDIQIMFRSPKSHLELGGKFHQDINLNAKTEKYCFQIIIPLEEGSFGTLFIPSHNKTFPEQIIQNKNTNAVLFKPTPRTGHTQQADPDKFFSMQKAPNTITHCIPAELDLDNSKNIKRPLLAIEFFLKK